MRSRHYLGNSFEVWKNERSWYWLVDRANCGGGSIGVTATEADAIGEACAAIEEISALNGVSMRTLRRSERFAMPDWMASLQNLERYLACAKNASA